ncbi:MAG: hypothetical protein JNL83_19295 [Myxococcales bacterium]|nr:hypothetical protein [Myxococcales bacterium]
MGMPEFRPAGDHPVLGPVDGLYVEGTLVTVMTRIDWQRPTRIPAIERPGAIPGGLGTVILNDLATRARAAGIPALRYAGPYPTAALYQSLLRSFRTTCTEDEFTRDVLDRALRGATDELPFDFVPAPHTRISHERGHVELRDGLERAVIDGVPYTREGMARLVVGGDDAHIRGVDDGVHAEVWIADRPYARVATFARDGALRQGPREVPACPSDVVGKEFPYALRAAIGELVVESVAPPLATRAREVLATATVTWADLGARAARRVDGGFEVHAALWDRLSPLGLGRVALALAEALAPLVAQAAVTDVAVIAAPWN